MQETYFTSQHSEWRGKLRYVHSYKKVKMTQHTHKPRIAHKTNPLLGTGVTPVLTCTCICLIVCAKHFVYNSCLFVSCNLNYCWRKNYMVSKLFIKIPLVK